MDFLTFLSRYPGDILVALFGLLVLLILSIPLALKLAGLSGQQIVDVISLTLQFFADSVRKSRAGNATKGD